MLLCNLSEAAQPRFCHYFKYVEIATEKQNPRLDHQNHLHWNLPLMSLEQAERYLLTGQSGSGAAGFQTYKVDILQALCVKYELAIKPTGKRGAVKSDYLIALNNHRVGHLTISQYRNCNSFFYNRMQCMMPQKTAVGCERFKYIF